MYAVYGFFLLLEVLLVRLGQHVPTYAARIGGKKYFLLDPLLDGERQVAGREVLSRARAAHANSNFEDVDRVLEYMFEVPAAWRRFVLVIQDGPESSGGHYLYALVWREECRRWDYSVEPHLDYSHGEETRILARY